MSKVSISCKEAVQLISYVARLVYEERGGEKPKGEVLNELERVLGMYGIEVPRKCNGDAHSNPYIDHCGVCMPNWGIIETEIKVR